SGHACAKALREPERHPSQVVWRVHGELARGEPTQRYPDCQVKLRIIKVIAVPCSAGRSGCASLRGITSTSQWTELPPSECPPPCFGTSPRRAPPNDRCGARAFHYYPRVQRRSPPPAGLGANPRLLCRTSRRIAAAGGAYC